MCLDPELAFQGRLGQHTYVWAETWDQDRLPSSDWQRAFNALCHSTHLYGRRLVLEWADSEVTLQALRRKTAAHFHEPPKKKRSVVLDEILEQLEGSDSDSEEQTLQL
nr:probable RNA-binding protein 19 [Macaca nemestrina]